MKKNIKPTPMTEAERKELMDRIREANDAILYYGDAEAYYDIFETIINI